MSYNSDIPGETVEQLLKKVMSGDVVTENTLHTVTNDDNMPITGAAVKGYAVDKLGFIVQSSVAVGFTEADSNMYVSVNDTWGSSVNADAAKTIRINAGDSVVVRSSAVAAKVAFVRHIGAQKEPVEYASNGAATAIAPNTTFCYSAVEDCVMWVSNNLVEGVRHPESITCYRAGIKEIEANAAQIERINSHITTLVAPNFIRQKKYIDRDGKWRDSIMTSASRYIEVLRNDTVRLVANDDATAIVAIVRRIGNAGDDADFGVGFSGRETIAAGTEYKITVQENGILYLYDEQDAFTTHFPKSVDIRRLGDTAVTRYAVNLCDELHVTAGVLDGGDIVDGASLVTDYLPLRGRPTQYLHVLCTTPTSSFAYAAERIAVYTAQCEYLGAIEQVTAAVDMESPENASLFGGDGYIRVQFPKSSLNMFVSRSNKRVMPEYSKYDISSLNGTTQYLADGIVNGSGAITHMLRTALSYVNRGSVTGLGYGDSATLFDQEVKAVTPDPWNADFYDGERKQINCSGFVQACLQGVSFENSRYVGPINLVSGYAFDSKLETNYHNSSAERYIPCSDYNKLYAKMLAKYASDRGYIYIIQEDLSNVRVGDVLFNSQDANRADYDGIVHCLFVAETYKMSHGGQKIDIMEVSGKTVDELAHISHYATKPSGWVYGARFPLPHRDVSMTDIVERVNVATTPVIVSSDPIEIAHATLKASIKAMGVYTVVIHANYVEGVDIYVRCNGKTYGGNGYELFQRRDGIVVKHFCVPYDDSLVTDNIDIMARCEGSAEGLSIDNIEVYSEYIHI